VVRRGRRRAQDRSQGAKYYRVARALRESATDLLEVADEDSSYGNAIAIVAIHSAIAYTDALTIAYGGFKSIEGDHTRAVYALQEAMGARVDPRRSKLLLAIIKEKDTVSYQGVYYSLDDARSLIERLNEFAEWAEGEYERRPYANY